MGEPLADLWSLRVPSFVCRRTSGVHADVLQRTGKSGEDAGHRRKSERRTQVSERLAGRAYELSGCACLRRPVVEPIEQDGEVQDVEDITKLSCLLFSGASLAPWTTSRKTPIFSCTTEVPSPSAEMGESGSSARVRRAARGARWGKPDPTSQPWPARTAPPPSPRPAHPGPTSLGAGSPGQGFGVSVSRGSRIPYEANPSNTVRNWINLAGGRLARAICEGIDPPRIAHSTTSEKLRAKMSS